MKVQNIFRFVLLVIVAVATFISCHSDDSKNSADEISDTITEGSWRISYFSDSGQDKTANYEGYNFTFANNTTMMASKETNSYTGQWFVNKSNSDDDLFSTIFKISMSPTDIFHDLNHDWKVVDNANGSLMLKDDSQGETDIDYLTFQKNEQ